MAKNNFLLFSSSAHPKLASEVENSLARKLGKIEITTFADSEKRVRVEENVRDKTVFVIASLCSPVDSNLVELCLIGDALKNNDAGKMVAVIPYYGYGRQDKAHRDGEGISARVMARLIEAVKFDKVVAVDFHSELVAGYFNIPVSHLYGAEVFVEPLKKLAEELVVVSPDAGAAKRAQKFADLLDAPLVFMEKKRNLDKLHTIDNMRLVGDVKDRTAVLIDDVVTSGSTLVKGAYALKEFGAKKVIACVTHADFIEGTDSILKDSPIDQMYVTDSIPIKEEQHFPRFHIIPLAPLLCGQINKMA